MQFGPLTNLQLKEVQEKHMEFVAFLLRAKLKTYDTGGEGNERNLDDGTREMSYREGNFFYRDRYFGFNPFIGEEVVWKNGKVIWGMNYYGAVTDESVSPGDVYRFLQKPCRMSLRTVPFGDQAIIAKEIFGITMKVKGT